MRRVMLSLAIVAILVLTSGRALAGGPDYHHGHHYGHYYGPYHHWHPAPPPPVVVYPPIYRPTVVVPAPVVVPAYPSSYYNEPQPHGGIGIYGQRFGVSIGF